MKQNLSRKNIIEGNQDFVENLLYILSNLGDDLVRKFSEKTFYRILFLIVVLLRLLLLF